MSEKGAAHTIEDLNRMYTDGESVDAEVFAEMRSNILLYAGDHYTKKNSAFYRRIRDARDLSGEQKLRLTKNHVQYICDTYVNNIVAPNPGVGFMPKNEKELHDQKVAELDHAIWRDAHEKYKIDDLIDEWADSFVQLGEVACKIYYDPSKGKIKGYAQKLSPEGFPLFTGMDGEPTTDDGSAMGMQHEPMGDLESPIYTGEFVFEEILGFNLIRPSECKRLQDAPWLGVRKMSYKKDLARQFPDKEKFLLESQDETYMVFDQSRNGYGKKTDQVLVIEYFFRPCHEYPEGYFYITTTHGVLAEGPLPGGVFPIAVKEIKKFKTTLRGRSPIKIMRPYQAEINRGASKMAEHQVTLGDDKLLIQNGTKVSAGAQIPGIRSVNYTGMKPEVLPGRTGEQYLNTINSNILELYQVMGVKEDNEELPSQLDPYVMLFRAARQKKRFQRYIKRFESFYADVVKIYLELARVHLPDDTLIYAIGATERVNIQEFRNQKDLCYDIVIEPQSEDVESKLGKQIVINHALQYVGTQLKPEDIGKLMRQMPYANFDESFDDMTIDYDSSVNDLLALDRGEQPPVNQYDNHVYCIKRLVARMRKSDFKYLNPQIQNNYAEKISIHQQFEAQNQLAIQRAKEGYIPTGGGMATCDLYVPDPKDPMKQNRVRLPVESLQWLIKQIEVQNSGLAPVLDMNGGAQAQISQKMTGTGMGQGQSGGPMASESPQTAINSQALLSS